MSAGEESSQESGFVARNRGTLTVAFFNGYQQEVLDQIREFSRDKQGQIVNVQMDQHEETGHYSNALVWYWNN